MIDVIDLASELIQIDSAGHDEDVVAAVLAEMLEPAGFKTEWVLLALGRSSLIARYNGGGKLVLSGHTDTVPFSSQGWSNDPLKPVIVDGRLLGRGSSDMKAGLAAICVAAARHAHLYPAGRGFSLIFSASEETGCQGAASLVAAGSIPAEALIVIGESTNNQLLYGHKGANWLSVVTRGIAAHGSRPELGRNAITELARAAIAVDGIALGEAHPYLGAGTLNIGTIRGGSQTNMVPDCAEMTIDMRTVPGMASDSVSTAITTAAPNSAIELDLELPPVWTDPDSARSRTLSSIVGAFQRADAHPGATAYFTDGARFVSAGVDLYICGPGDPAQPHTANEGCAVEKIEEAVEVYFAILSAWQNGTLN